MQKAVIMLAFAVGILIPTAQAKCSAKKSGCATAASCATMSCATPGSCTMKAGTCTMASTAAKAKAKAVRRIGR